MKNKGQVEKFLNQMDKRVFGKAGVKNARGGKRINKKIA